MRHVAAGVTIQAMPAILLETTVGDVLEVVVAGGLVVAALNVFVAIPFFVQYFIDDRREREIPPAERP